MDSRSLQAFIDQNRIAAQIVHCAAPTPTVEAAAQVMGVAPDQIVKTILFVAGGQMATVIACGTAPIDRKPIATRFGVGRKQVKLADAETVLAVTGYPAGTVPPFGHREAHRTFVDPRVLAQPFVYAGGGEEDALVRLDPADLLRITGGELLPVTAGEPPEKGAAVE
jgi:prolyl-tRNA editing enzyme YbaK/EbsC (Cys-tRNA(Pro) deacylase)